MKLFINEWIQTQRKLYKERNNYPLGQNELSDIIGISQAQISKKLSAGTGDYSWSLREFAILCAFFELDISKEISKIKFQEWDLSIKQKSLHRKKQKQKLFERIRKIRLAESYGKTKLIPFTSAFSILFPENCKQECASKRNAYSKWYTEEMKKEDEGKLLQHLILISEIKEQPHA